MTQITEYKDKPKDMQFDHVTGFPLTLGLDEMKNIIRVYYVHTPVSYTHLDVYKRQHFIRVFRRAMGITPYQYLRQVRLNRAASLLRRGQSVSGAAAACGFESAAALSHAMRKSRSVSPGEIRGME